MRQYISVYFFFFNDTATTEIYTLSLHDALPISWFAGIALPLTQGAVLHGQGLVDVSLYFTDGSDRLDWYSRASLLTLAGLLARSEEHTSELQSRQYLVCRLLLEKKKIILL